MSYALRYYQADASARSVEYLRDRRMKNRNGIIVAPTGSGKSLIIASIATSLDGPCIVFQPTKEILEQNAAKLAAYGFPPAIYSASFNKRNLGEITLATIGSVAKQQDLFKDYKYLLIDECHLVNPKQGMYRTFLKSIAGARVLGLTATPFRLASNSYGAQLRFLTRQRPRVFRDVVHATQIGDLFRQGYLSPLEYRQRAILNQTRMIPNSTGAEFTDGSVQRHFAEVGFPTRLQSEVEALLAEGRRQILVFTAFVADAMQLAASIPGAAFVSADTPSAERARILTDFREGRIRVVANVGILTVGFDHPQLDTVVLARPSLSLALYYQMVGRVIRPHPDKPSALVVDLVGLVERFGQIEDLTLETGGERGDLWVMTSAGRPLTNEYYGKEDVA